MGTLTLVIFFPSSLKAESKLPFPSICVKIIPEGQLPAIIILLLGIKNKLLNKSLVPTKSIDIIPLAPKVESNEPLLSLIFRITISRLSIEVVLFPAINIELFSILIFIK